MAGRPRMSPEKSPNKIKKEAGLAATANAFEEAAATKAAAKPLKEVPSWQEGKRAVTVWVDEEQYRRVNHLHYEVRKPVRELFQEALDLMLLAYDQEPRFKGEALRLMANLRKD